MRADKQTYFVGNMYSTDRPKMFLDKKTAIDYVNKYGGYVFTYPPYCREKKTVYVPGEHCETNT